MNQEASFKLDMAASYHLHFEINKQKEEERSAKKKKEKNCQIKLVAKICRLKNFLFK